MSHSALVIQPPAAAESGPWIGSTASPGLMRLIVNVPPERWTPTVHAAIRLVDVIDSHHRAGRDADANDAALELDGLLAVLARDGIMARLAS